MIITFREEDVSWFRWPHAHLDTPKSDSFTGYFSNEDIQKTPAVKTRKKRREVKNKDSSDDEITQLLRAHNKRIMDKNCSQPIESCKAQNSRRSVLSSSTVSTQKKYSNAGKRKNGRSDSITKNKPEIGKFKQVTNTSSRRSYMNTTTFQVDRNIQSIVSAKTPSVTHKENVQCNGKVKYPTKASTYSVSVKQAVYTSVSTSKNKGSKRRSESSDRSDDLDEYIKEKLKIHNSKVNNHRIPDVARFCGKNSFKK